MKTRPTVTLETAIERTRALMADNRWRTHTDVALRIDTSSGQAGVALQRLLDANELIVADLGHGTKGYRRPKI